jgi:hypothetical protein
MEAANNHELMLSQALKLVPWTAQSTSEGLVMGFVSRSSTFATALCVSFRPKVILWRSSIDLESMSLVSPDPQRIHEVQGMYRCDWQDWSLRVIGLALCSKLIPLLLISGYNLKKAG